MAVVKEIYMSKICSLIAFVYLGYIGSSLAWADHHCPSEDKETHECYELTIEPRTCVSYGIQCCSNTYNGYFCQLCLKEEYRPCPLYMCTNRGCCKGWAEDEFGQCSIPTGSEIICENGGVLYGNSSMCRCPQSFTGDRCEITVCEVNCQNGGTCAMVEEEPTCICPSSYFSGNFCEIVTCTEDCLHGGQCIEDGVIARCQCQDGYRGRACEVLTSNMCPINPDDLKNSDCNDAIHECLSDNDCNGNKVCCLNVTSNMCPINPDDLKNSDCNDAIHECLSNNDCHGNKVCCWNGCAGECKMPDDVKCYLESQTFNVGDIYRPSVCSVCICQPLGEMKCEQMNCTSLECPGGHFPLAIEGQCCMKCPGNDTPSAPQEPSFVNCPAHFVEASVRKNSDIALLPEMQLAAKDYKGETLGIFYSQTQFRHSRTSDIYRNTHIVMAYSYADRNGRVAECSFKVLVRDKQAPVFTTCPVEILTYDDKVVTWVAPVPEDNVGISQIVAEGDFYQDKKLRHGTYSISYTALDYDQNKAICAFNIYVYKSDPDWTNYPDYDYYYYNGVPTGTIIGISTGTVVMVFFTIWMCVRIKQNRRAEAEDRAAETNTLASTADSGPNSTVYAMAGRVAQMYTDVTRRSREIVGIAMPKDIKLPAYSPPMNPPSYEELGELGEAEQGQGQSLPFSPPIYEEIPEQEETKVLTPHYQNLASGVENPTYSNSAGDEDNIIDNSRN